MKRFEGKTIWISGAAKGIGQCAAIEFAREGGKVIATDVDTEGLKAAFVDHPELSIDTMAQDVTNFAEWERLGKEVTAKHGKLDVLVNNAGIADLPVSWTSRRKNGDRPTRSIPTACSLAPKPVFA